MPMYDFHCSSCGHDFEDIAPMAGPPPACPQCARPTERVMSAPIYAPKRMSAKGQMHAERHKRNPPKPYK
jgi:putative FmdB family regulatory protein